MGVAAVLFATELQIVRKSAHHGQHFLTPVERPLDTL